MAAVSPLPTDPARKSLQMVLRRLARMSVAEIGAAIEKDESTASRLRSGEAKLNLEEFAKLLAAIGCKVVDERKRCVDPEIYEALVDGRRSGMNVTILACAHKKRYPSETAAWSVIFTLRAKGRDTERLTPFQCEFCSKWHLGRKPRS